MGTTAEKLQKILDTKSAIKNSIIAKGGTIADDTKFSDYSLAIDNLPSGGSGNEWVDPKELRNNMYSSYDKIYPNFESWAKIPLPSEIPDDGVSHLYASMVYTDSRDFSVSPSSCMGITHDGNYIDVFVNNSKISSTTTISRGDIIKMHVKNLRNVTINTQIDSYKIFWDLSVKGTESSPVNVVAEYSNEIKHVYSESFKNVILDNYEFLPKYYPELDNVHIKDNIFYNTDVTFRVAPTPYFPETINYKIRKGTPTANYSADSNNIIYYINSTLFDNSLDIPIICKNVNISSEIDFKIGGFNILAKNYGINNFSTIENINLGDKCSINTVYTFYIDIYTDKININGTNVCDLKQQNITWKDVYYFPSNIESDIYKFIDNNNFKFTSSSGLTVQIYNGNYNLIDNKFLNSFKTKFPNSPITVNRF